MLKHRRFPGRLPSSDQQFVIRRANPKGATKLIARERFRDRSAQERRADTAFLAALIEHFGDEPFERGNLDAGRLSWLLGREVQAVGKLDPTSYEQLLRVDMARAEASFPELFADEAPDFGWGDDEDDDADED
ncbi:hypothetical protein DRW48_07805 [Paracoccus suum]|uniref:Uncharacterized protein n=1 Tax=Paracoccus suum TaxID=2259340 RepID=A0A344PJQ3_9RHOB|nr:hypothetical protein [Paracoccus suum]AXC49608.1 hypothetical protein DRW48_07805 [Paracoccus suum]